MGHQQGAPLSMSRRSRIAAGIAASVIAFAMLAVVLTAFSHPSIAPEDLLQAIAAAKAPPIIDVRTSREYQAGHITGAIHIPHLEVWFHRREFPAAKTDPIVVYCSHGPRAWIAAFQLWTLSYQNVASLQRHMSGWERQGFPLRTGAAP